MAWSTREIAERSGTTVAAVRHYHRLGLLDEPLRTSNSYKQYEVRHLVRLLRIRRLVALGVPLAHIASFDTEEETTTATLRVIDENLASSIERAMSARADIAKLLQESAPADTPQGFETLASRLSDIDNSLLHIYRRFYDDQAMAKLRHIIENDTSSVSRQISSLTSDTEEAIKQRLVESLAPILAQNILDNPWLKDSSAHLTARADLAEQTIAEAILELYNPTQRDVFYRASVLAQKQLGIQASDIASRFRPIP